MWLSRGYFIFFRFYYFASDFSFVPLYAENKEEKKSKEPDRFIETYLAGDTFNEAQKEFLIKCLEEGDTVEEMKTYASASLTPAMMQRLRQVRKKRRGQ